MKLASVVIEGRPAFGLVEEGGFVDLSALLEGTCADLREFLAAGDGLRAHAATLAAQAPRVPLSRLTYLPPIPNRDARMFSLGWSYRDHQLETGKEAPTHPFLFSKHPQSMVGHGQPLVRPQASSRFDYEGEVVVVIGTPGRHIPLDRALAHVAGYAIGMDGSIRDWQQHSVTAGKNFDGSSAYGPWLVTADAIADPGAMQLTTRLNGAVMQSSAFGLLAWSVAELVAYVSTITRLEAGDAISTGTPGGVGHKRQPPVFLRAGDVLEVEVSGLGVLRNPVVDE